jgi:hypothetical protein
MERGQTMNILNIGTKDGDVEIREDELPTITKADLKKLGISHKDLLRCFAEGVELMKERKVKPGDRVRPVADQHIDGSWEVNLVGYSPISDPLMNVPIPGGKH